VVVEQIVESRAPCPSGTGNVETGQWLLDEAVRRADIKINEVKSEGGRVSDDNKADVSEMVGVGAVKWALLRASIGKDIEFSFDESVSLEGNSGPYLQYTYVRTRSVLEKAGNLSPQTEPEIKLSAEERSLLVLLSQYQDIVLEASEKYASGKTFLLKAELGKSEAEHEH